MSFIDGAADQGSEVVSPEPTQPELSQHAQQFLNDVPEEHRAILDTHLRKWDSGFTKYSQSMQEKLKPYETLGPPERLRQAHELLNQLENDPASIAEFLVTNGYYTVPASNPQPEAPQIPEEIAGYLKPFEEKLSKFDQLERAVSVIAQQFQAQAQQRQQQEEDAKLQATMAELKKEHGEFDEQFVLTKAMSNGGDLAAAVADFKRLEQNLINRGSAAPRVLGTNSLPQITKTPQEMTPDERRSLMLAKLQNLQG